MSDAIQRTVLICLVKVAALSALVGYSFLWLGELTDSIITEIAPSYYLAMYPQAVRFSTEDLDAPRKLGNGDLLLCASAFGVVGESILLICCMVFVDKSLYTLIRLTAMSIAGAMLGAILGGSLGRLVAIFFPNSVKTWYASGKEAWFVPADMTVVDGAELGFVTMFMLCGAAFTWHLKNTSRRDVSCQHDS